MVNYKDFSVRSPSVHTGRMNVWRRHEQNAAQKRDMALFYSQRHQMNYNYNWFQPMPQQNEKFNLGYAIASIGNGLNNMFQSSGIAGMFKNWFS